ncbi:MAG: hypothetical protein ACK4NA_14825 [Alphaproteobacteria bacterium]
MDLFLVEHIRENVRARHGDGWLYVAAVEADTTRRAGAAIEFLALAVVRGVKALAVRAVAVLRGEGLVPVRVAARQQRVDLAARNDDRAAA